MICEDLDGEITCPTGSVIETVNATKHDFQGVCILNGGHEPESMDHDLFDYCTGSHSCIFLNKKMNISNYFSHKSWKLKIFYHCVSKYNSTATVLSG